MIGPLLSIFRGWWPWGRAASDTSDITAALTTTQALWQAVSATTTGSWTATNSTSDSSSWVVRDSSGTSHTFRFNWYIAIDPGTSPLPETPQQWSNEVWFAQPAQPPPPEQIQQLQQYQQYMESVRATETLRQQLEENLQAQQVERAEAERRADVLLAEILSQDELHRFKTHGYVEIPSQRHTHRYRIRAHRRVGLVTNGQERESLCIVPEETYPEYDRVVSLVLMARFNEEELLRVGILNHCAP